MKKHPSPAGPATSGAVRFDERLSVPWWWYLVSLGVAGLMAAQIHMGYPGIRSWIGYVVLLPAALAVVLWLGRARVRVAGGALHAGERSVPLSSLGRVDVVRGRDERQVALGPDLDPTAFVLLRSYVPALVRVEITDPASPEPYWVLSARRADELAKALTDGR